MYQTAGDIAKSIGCQLKDKKRVKAYWVGLLQISGLIVNSADVSCCAHRIPSSWLAKMPMSVCVSLSWQFQLLNSFSAYIGPWTEWKGRISMYLSCLTLVWGSNWWHLRIILFVGVPIAIMHRSAWPGKVNLFKKLSHLLVLTGSGPDQIWNCCTLDFQITIPWPFTNTTCQACKCRLTSMSHFDQQLYLCIRWTTSCMTNWSHKVLLTSYQEHLQNGELHPEMPDLQVQYSTLWPYTKCMSHVLVINELYWLLSPIMDTWFHLKTLVSCDWNHFWHHILLELTIVSMEITCTSVDRREWKHMQEKLFKACLVSGGYVDPHLCISWIAFFFWWIV